MSLYLNIEVAYALPERQTLVALRVKAGCTAEQAVIQSGILAQHPELDRKALKLGIFSRAVAADTPLRENDRVEIYRPLLADPKQARRRRAADAKVGGVG